MVRRQDQKPAHCWHGTAWLAAASGQAHAAWMRWPERRVMLGWRTPLARLRKAALIVWRVGQWSDMRFGRGPARAGYPVLGVTPRARALQCA